MHRSEESRPALVDRWIIPGSTDGDEKFPLAVRAIDQPLRMLSPDDDFSAVAYDNVSTSSRAR